MYNRLHQPFKEGNESVGCFMLLFVLVIIVSSICISKILQPKKVQTKIEHPESGCDITETDTLDFYMPVFVGPEV